MALRTSRIVKKYAPFYSRVRDSEASDSDEGMRSRAPTARGSSLSSSSSSFTWLHRAFSSGFTHAHVVPLSESPKRELRMRTRTRRHHQHSKKHKKHFPRLWW